jgi:hypothetical protein
MYDIVLFFVCEFFVHGKCGKPREYGYVLCWWCGLGVSPMRVVLKSGCEES